MAEIKVITELSNGLTYQAPKHRPSKKRWIVAQGRPDKGLKVRNECTEAAYHLIIDTIKKHHLNDGDIYYDRDLKTDPSQGFLSMHSLLCSSFYIYLQCDFTYDYTVEYAFCNCPFEAEIRKMLAVHPLTTQAKEVALKPDFTTYYQTVLKVQDQQFIHSFKGS